MRHDYVGLGYVILCMYVRICIEESLQCLELESSVAKFYIGV